MTAEDGGNRRGGRIMYGHTARKQEWRLPRGKWNRTGIGAGMLLTAAAAVGGFFAVTKEAGVLAAGGSVLVLAAIWTAVMYEAERRELQTFMEDVGKLLDTMEGVWNREGMQKPEEMFRKITGLEEETLISRLGSRFCRLYEMMEHARLKTEEEKKKLQSLVSDISHQVKTPIANLKMLDATLLEQNVSPEKQREFLLAMDSQLDKLDFLMQAMIKTSRLEAGVIALEPKPQAIYDTLAAALGGILLNAEQKKITVTVDCPETVTAAHDRKWTTEALFNILDNAVKYTPESGKIHVAVVCWEMYVKIDISDTGIGIPEQHQGTIFKRFYREDRVHDAPGIGIGLYLTREIITRQGGFIRVASEVGSGSTFSVFLPHS